MCINNSQVIKVKLSGFVLHITNLFHSQVYFWAWHFGLNVCKVWEGKRSCSGCPAVLLVGEQCQGDRQLVCIPKTLLFLSCSHQQHTGMLEAGRSLLSSWCGFKVPAVNLSDKVSFYCEFFFVLLLGGRSSKLMVLRRLMYHLNDLEKSWIYSDQWKKSHWLQKKYIFHLWFS